jgi:hypothetical protein
MGACLPLPVPKDGQAAHGTQMPWHPNHVQCRPMEATHAGGEKSRCLVPLRLRENPRIKANRPSSPPGRTHQARGRTASIATDTSTRFILSNPRGATSTSSFYGVFVSGRISSLAARERHTASQGLPAALSVPHGRAKRCPGLSDAGRSGTMGGSPALVWSTSQTQATYAGGQKSRCLVPLATSRQSSERAGQAGHGTRGDFPRSSSPASEQRVAPVRRGRLVPFTRTRRQCRSTASHGLHTLEGNAE